MFRFVFSFLLFCVFRQFAVGCWRLLLCLVLARPEDGLRSRIGWPLARLYTPVLLCRIGSRYLIVSIGLVVNHFTFYACKQIS